MVSWCCCVPLFIPAFLLTRSCFGHKSVVIFVSRYGFFFLSAKLLCLVSVVLVQGAFGLMQWISLLMQMRAELSFMSTFEYDSKEEFKSAAKPHRQCSLLLDLILNQINQFNHNSFSNTLFYRCRIFLEVS